MPRRNKRTNRQQDADVPIPREAEQPQQHNTERSCVQGLHAFRMEHFQGNLGEEWRALENDIPIISNVLELKRDTSLYEWFDMSQKHENVSCDSCLRSKFTGKRYKCLVCSDYDLCEGCRANKDNRHFPGHPMQCILTQYDLALHLGDEMGPALTCPICGELGYTELTLQNHLISAHPNQGNRELMCPACALLPMRESNMLAEDLVNHLRIEHMQREGEDQHKDPIGELLSTLSKQGRQYRPTSTCSLLRPLHTASSSGLSIRKAPPPPESKPAPRDTFLLASVMSVPQSEEVLESKDEITAPRSVFTSHLLYSLLSKQDIS